MRTRRIKIDLYKWHPYTPEYAGSVAAFCVVYLFLGIRFWFFLMVAMAAGFIGVHWVRRKMNR